MSEGLAPYSSLRFRVSPLVLAIGLGMGGGVFLLGAFLASSAGEEPYSALLLILSGLLLAGGAIFLLGMVHPTVLVHLCLMGVILDQWEGLAFTGVPFLTVSKLLILLAILILMVRAWFAPPRGAPFRFPAPVLAHLPFSFLCLVSALAFGYSLRNSLRWVIAPLTLPIFALVLSQFVRTPKEAVRLIRSFAIYSFFPIGIALAETVMRRRIGGSFDIFYYGARDIFRVAGNFDNPNDFVVLILFSVPVLLLWMVSTRSRPLRVFLAAGAALQGMILLKTYSRSGYLSMAFVFVSMAILGRGRNRRLGVVVCLLGAIALFSLPDVRERVLSLIGVRPTSEGAAQAVASLNYRKMLLAVGWNEFLEHPMLGTGFGNIGAEAKKYSTLLYQSSIENTYLEILAEMGLVGLLAYLLFLVVSGRVLFTGLKNSRGHPLSEPFFLALACGYCGFVLNGLFDTNLVDNIPWVLLPLFLQLGAKVTGETS